MTSPEEVNPFIEDPKPSSPAPESTPAAREALPTSSTSDNVEDPSPFTVPLPESGMADSIAYPFSSDDIYPQDEPPVGVQVTSPPLPQLPNDAHEQDEQEGQRENVGQGQGQHKVYERPARDNIQVRLLPHFRE